MSDFVYGVIGIALMMSGGQMKYALRSALLSVAVNAAFILAIAYETGWKL